MKKQDVITGIIVLVVLIVGLFLIRRAKTQKIVATPIPTPSIQQRVSDKFGGLSIPDDVDKADLKPVVGTEGVGIATRKVENGRFDLTVLADLPAPEEGYFYQAWFGKGGIGQEGSVIVSASRLRIAKGGYLSEFTSTESYTDYKDVFVTLEKNFDQTPEKQVLEGSF